MSFIRMVHLSCNGKEKLFPSPYKPFLYLHVCVVSNIPIINKKINHFFLFFFFQWFVP